MNTPATPKELHDAFRRAGLWRLGITYEHAIGHPLLLKVMNCSVKSHRRRLAQAGIAVPAQPQLI